MCVSDCKYDVVREAALARGWKLVDEDPESSSRKCHVYWVDVPMVVERTQQLHPWQRINHFPGMSNVARKSRLAQNLGRMRRSFPSEFSFYPRTWVLPVEWGSFKGEFDAQGKSSRTFIIKPDSGCQGKGIFLTQDLDRVDCMESQVAQIYVRKPLLIEGLKFDLRVYVLVTSVMPLRVYVFKDGLARFCTEEYLRPSSDNLGERCMHLTNYAVNKCSDNFIANEAADRDDCGSKRSLRWLLEWITMKHGGDSARALWRKMCSACVKTLASILPTLHREYLHVFGPDKRVRCPANDGRLDEASTPRDGEPMPRGTTREHLRDEEAESGRSDATANKRDTVGDPMTHGLSSESASRPRELDQARPMQNRREDAKQISGASSGHEAEPGEDVGPPPTETPEGSEYQDHPTQRVVEGSRCVEILGFDFMIDSSLKPWLIEVNHLPSFATDSPLDKRIKSQVVGTTLSIFRAKANDKKSFEGASKRDAQLRLYPPVQRAGVAKKEQERRREAEAVVTIIRRKAISCRECKSAVSFHPRAGYSRISLLVA